jgi:hypothetical protein
MMMNTTEGFVRNLFRNEKPSISTLNFDDPDVWVCDLLNESAELANEYIRYRLDNAHSNDNRLSFLYDCRHCFKCALDELRFYKENPDFVIAPTCCGNPYYHSPDEGILIYKLALNKVEHAICHYQDCEKLACSESPSDAKPVKNPENTTTRQVLAMYYLADHLGIWGRIDKSGLESFSEFLTGKSSSEIHKKFIRPLDNKQDLKERKKDFMFVKGHFERLGLRDVVEQIKRDMD